MGAACVKNEGIEAKYLPAYLKGFEVRPIAWSGKQLHEVIEDIFLASRHIKDDEIILACKSVTNLCDIPGAEVKLLTREARSCIAEMLGNATHADAIMWVCICLCRLKSIDLQKRLVNQHFTQELIAASGRVTTSGSAKWWCNAFLVSYDDNQSHCSASLTTALTELQPLLETDNNVCVWIRVVDVSTRDPYFSTTNLCNASLQAAHRLRSAEAVQHFCQSWLHMFKNPSLQRHFCTLEFRDALVMISKYASTTASVTPWVRLVATVLKQSAQVRRCYCVAALRDSVVELSSHVESESVAMWFFVAVSLTKEVPQLFSTVQCKRSVFATSENICDSIACESWCRFVLHVCNQPEWISAADSLVDITVNVSAHADAWMVGIVCAALTCTGNLMVSTKSAVTFCHLMRAASTFDAARSLAQTVLASTLRFEGGDIDDVLVQLLRTGDDDVVRDACAAIVNLAKVDGISRGNAVPHSVMMAGSALKRSDAAEMWCKASRALCTPAILSTLRHVAGICSSSLSIEALCSFLEQCVPSMTSSHESITTILSISERLSEVRGFARGSLAVARLIDSIQNADAVGHILSVDDQFWNFVLDEGKFAQSDEAAWWLCSAMVSMSYRNEVPSRVSALKATAALHAMIQIVTADHTLCLLCHAAVRLIETEVVSIKKFSENPELVERWLQTICTLAQSADSVHRGCDLLRRVLSRVAVSHSLKLEKSISVLSPFATTSVAADSFQALVKLVERL